MSGGEHVKIAESVIVDTTLTDESFRVYAMLCVYADATGFVTVTMDEIAQHAGLSRPSLDFCLDELQERGHITVHRVGSVNRVYVIALHNEWKAGGHS